MKGDGIPLVLNPHSLDRRRGSAVLGKMLEGTTIYLSSVPLVKYSVYKSPTVHHKVGREGYHFSESGQGRECQSTARQHQQKSGRINDPPFII